METLKRYPKASTLIIHLDTLKMISLSEIKYDSSF